jgi:hypothetical protein
LFAPATACTTALLAVRKRDPKNFNGFISFQIFKTAVYISYKTDPDLDFLSLRPLIIFNNLMTTHKLLNIYARPLEILVSSFFVFGDIGCMIFFTMVSVRKARLLKNVNKHFRNSGGQNQRKMKMG